jgi:hypothetical protein
MATSQLSIKSPNAGAQRPAGEQCEPVVRCSVKFDARFHMTRY